MHKSKGKIKKHRRKTNSNNIVLTFLSFCIETYISSKESHSGNLRLHGCNTIAACLHVQFSGLMQFVATSRLGLVKFSFLLAVYKLTSICV